MRTFQKPTVVISKCLEHAACRYDGTMIKSEVVEYLKPYVNFITVCPEMEIGLPAPREALRIVRDDDKADHLVFSKSGEEKTSEMLVFSDAFLKNLTDVDVDGFILKHRSPSCGFNDVKMYKGPGKSNIYPGKTSGVFGGRVKAYYDDYPVENEGRLRHFNIREQFLIGIFTLSTFREVKGSGTLKALVKFHSENKYLFMALSPGTLKVMGKIVANHDKCSVEAVYTAYEVNLKKILLQPMNRSRNINALLHVYGYFKKDLSDEEKVYFLDNIELYMNKKIPLSVLIALLRSWVIRFDEPYLSTQTLFEPYPKELFNVTDSGKGL